MAFTAIFGMAKRMMFWSLIATLLGFAEAGFGEELLHPLPNFLKCHFYRFAPCDYGDINAVAVYFLKVCAHNLAQAPLDPVPNNRALGDLCANHKA